ncbi:DNA binding protein [Gordonia phage Strosahl]|uniref:DNA binding protein n=3 Tax=Soupsvirus TaxID=1982562 RepID=A0A1B3B194_9CAUD|nr:sigma-K factor [Gordonia phage Soups]YP_009281671.1 sigma-K factor [Gordonia phage Remus]YP_009286000.1 sigma-K factor [Gordonia phage JSwag]YP_009596261.1 sigma-K factor [Gordonia phage Strosahl]AXH47856.1 DNA binding protein [Gordonia phage LastResort]QDM56234.1 DNA binding protein [Gordonia phage ReMo]QLF84930.1 RNA polymerase sigma factor [Gordonia phage Epsocamisio]UAJ15550.1 DNA binding protein [Gordonia Phage Boohoo]UVD39805.1 DNA binding protein [Gordonia phage Anaysia]WKW87371.
MEDLRVKVLGEDITKAAKSVAYQWPGIVEAEDIEQGIWEHILARPGAEARLMNSTPTGRYKAIVHFGHQIASQERTDYDHFSGNYRYSVDEVKKALVEFMPEGPGVAGTATSEIKLDIERSLFKLNDRYFDLVVRRYGEQESIRNGADKEALSQAVASLTDLMNSSNKQQHADRTDGPGSRPKVTNAQPV